MDYKIKNEDKKMTVSVIGDIDHHAADFLRREIEVALRRDKPEALTLDFTGVELMDSSGFGFVMGRYKTMCEIGGTIQVIGCNSRVLKMLKMAGTDKFMNLEGRKNNGNTK